MNNVFVYCEIEGTTVQEVSQELLTKGRKLADTLGVELNAIVAGTGIKGKVEDQILPYGVDKLFVFDGEGLFPYTSAPHTDIVVNLFKEEQPQIALMGATVIGRDLGPRVSSSLTSGLTADCTQLEIGEYDDKKSGKHYDSLLYQIRPAFGGNIVATIVNPEHRPQMATVRSGVMQKALYQGKAKGEVVYPDPKKYVNPLSYAVQVIDRHVEAAKNNLKSAPIVVAGGYGVGSKEGFDMLFQLAKELHGEVGASRAAVDAGWVRQASLCIQRCTSLAASAVRFSISQVCRTQASSYLSIATRTLLSTRLPTTSSPARWRKSFRNSSNITSRIISNSFILQNIQQ